MSFQNTPTQEYQQQSTDEEISVDDKPSATSQRDSNHCPTCGFTYSDEQNSLETQNGASLNSGVCDNVQFCTDSEQERHRKAIVKVGKQLARIGDSLWEKRNFKT